MTPNDVNAQLHLLRTLLEDLDRHLYPKKMAAENIEICQNLINSDDAKRMLSQEFLAVLQSRVNHLSETLVKKAQDDMRFVRDRISRR